ncbi:hypothetical protein [Sinimarinibacterium thermocellulolyticum]|uniref:DUF4175 domain-containing protein n=1 Tax=Sinimarinibacterium thermocellulolyticum TaxID=3170016 RepID=A0ABV2A7W9_9GAMM
MKRAVRRPIAIWGWPVAVFLGSLFGLFTALWHDGGWDLVATAMLASSLVAIVWPLARSTRCRGPSRRR